MSGKSFLLFLKEYRLKDWWYFLCLMLLGYLASRPLYAFYDLLIRTLISVALLAFSFSWNELHDRGQAKGNLIPPLIPILFIIFLINYLDLRIKILSSVFFFITFFYSLPPIRLKSIPIICTFCNAFGFSLLFLLGVDNFKNQPLLPLYLGLFFLLFVAQLIHELAHSSQDRLEKIYTTAIFLGEKKTKILIISFLFFALISFYKLSFIIGGLSILLAIHITTLLIQKNINYHLLRKIYRYDGIILGIAILLFLLYK